MIALDRHVTYLGSPLGWNRHLKVAGSLQASRFEFGQLYEEKRSSDVENPTAKMCCGAATSFPSSPYASSEDWSTRFTTFSGTVTWRALQGERQLQLAYMI